MLSRRRLTSTDVEAKRRGIDVRTLDVDSSNTNSAPYWERCAGKSTGSTDDSTGRATHLRFCRLVEDDRHFEAATSNRRSHSLAIRCERKD
ncbi:hypothetical protein PF005_g27421 [Phytophthora fragariae]|uniref:Uncharacterized protein n=1 Tax=Phytophthora fragariae TaxID=53985 RepID=A0A6A3VNW3_9STRA|nr:hypothetical protein PF005_g27421 [Phytophthora fragariae]